MLQTGSRDGNIKKKVLVYLFGSLGDSLVAIPALRAVRRFFHDAEIVMLQNFEAGNIVASSQVIPNELVDRYLTYDSRMSGKTRFAGFYDLWRSLKAERFSAAAYLIMSERPAKAVLRDRIFFRSAGIKQLYGFHALSDAELCPLDENGHPAPVDHEAVLKIKRLELDGIESNLDEDFCIPLMTFSESELTEIDLWLGSKRKFPDLPLITLGPGCKSQANVWPIESFARLGNQLMKSYPCEIIIVGGKAELEIGEKLIEVWGSGINAAGQFSVRQSAALLTKSAYHIGLDTGTTHLAAAVGTRCFAIYGEKNNPGMWYPLGNGHTLVYHPVKCAGCHLPACDLPGHPCMNGIPYESVWYNLERFVNGTEPHDRASVHVIAV